jgi:hypothetical protein
MDLKTTHHQSRRALPRLASIPIVLSAAAERQKRRFPMPMLQSIAIDSVMRFLCFVALFTVSLFAAAAGRHALDISGPVSLEPSGVATIGFMRIESIANNTDVWSGEIRIRLLATTTAALSDNYSIVSEFVISPASMPPMQSRSQITGNIPLARIPDGVYYLHVAVFEFEPASSCGNASPDYCMDDYVTLDNQFRSKDGVYSLATTPPPAPITPQLGNWWNPIESGTGYAFDIRGNTLIVTVYSFLPDGSPTWYLAYAPLVGNEATMSLQKFRNGQCLSCVYSAPVNVGSDGSMTVTFTSATSALMRLPGRAVFSIRPLD